MGSAKEEYMRRSIEDTVNLLNATEEAKVLLKTLEEARAVLTHIDQLAGCQSSNYTDVSLALGECRTIARTFLTKLKHGS